MTLPPTPSLPPAETSGHVPVNGISIWYATFGSGPPLRRVSRLGTIDFYRIALTEEDVESDELALPSFDADTKRTDVRYQWFVENHGQRCVGLDALSPPILRGRVEDAIRNRIIAETWKRAERVEEAEIRSMNDFLSKWKPASVED